MTAKELANKFRRTMKGFDEFLKQSPNPAQLKNHIVMAISAGIDVNVAALRAQLAESQAREQQLREALDGLMKAHVTIFRNSLHSALSAGNQSYLDAWRKANDALSASPAPALSSHGTTDSHESVLAEKDKAELAALREQNAKQAGIIEAWMKQHRIPNKSYRPAEAFINEKELVILGSPETEDHNCDAMGCSSVSHVLWRGNPAELEALAAVARVREGK